MCNIEDYQGLMMLNVEQPTYPKYFDNLTSQEGQHIWDEIKWFAGYYDPLHSRLAIDNQILVK